MKREAKEWRQSIQRKIVEPVIAAVREIAPQLRDIELELDKRTIFISPPRKLAEAEWKLVRNAAEERIESTLGSVSPLKIRLRRPAVFGYTFHSPAAGVGQLPTTCEDITEFTLDLKAIESLAAAYKVLWESSREFDLVITFALGGLPALNFVTWKDFNVQKLDDPTSLQGKYHLFPGLQWKMKPESPKQLLRTWLQSLSGGRTALFFDTGTEGNGVRETFNVLREHLENCDRSPFTRVVVLGLVDGSSPEQQSTQLLLRDRTGSPVQLDISYYRVEDVLTEDVAALAGYESLRTRGIVRPYSSSAVMHILDSGRKISTIAASASGVVISLLIERKLQELRRGEMVDPELHDEVAGSFLLSAAFDRERSELQNAYEMGFVSSETHSEVMEFLTNKYRQRHKNQQGMRKKASTRKARSNRLRT
jgi:hypothetical protein